jgi:ferritin-like metal-binding protein YciE
MNPLRIRLAPPMQGLIKEAGELMEEQKDSTALDAALIAAGQKVEHYEMASYGTLRKWAMRKPSRIDRNAARRSSGRPETDLDC